MPFYNFRFTFHEQGLGPIDKILHTDAENITEALDKFAKMMNCKTQEALEWVLIGTTINGVDAAQFIQKEKDMGHGKELGGFVDQRDMLAVKPAREALISKREYTAMRQKALDAALQGVIEALNMALQRGSTVVELKRNDVKIADPNELVDALNTYMRVRDLGWKALVESFSKEESDVRGDKWKVQYLRITLS